MTKRQDFINRFRESIIVTTEDIKTIAKEVLGEEKEFSYIFKRYVSPLVTSGELIRVRRGLYCFSETFEELRYRKLSLLAKLCEKRGFLGYSSALRYYGVYTLMTDYFVNVCVPRQDYFEPFRFKGIGYESIIVQDLSTEIEDLTIERFPVRVSSMERTFVDCIDSPERAGGWELSFKSLRGLKVDLDKVFDLLRQRGKQILYRKMGVIMEIMGEESPSNYPSKEVNRFLDRLEDLIEGAPRYIAQRKTWSGRWIRADPWKLYIPDTFEPGLRLWASTDPIFT